jgi:hypothetical protein
MKLSWILPETKFLSSELIHLLAEQIPSTAKISRFNFQSKHKPTDQIFCKNQGDEGFYFQHELHLWIYYMSKFLNTSEFIIMIIFIILNLWIELIIKPQALDKTSCYKCNGGEFFKFLKKIVFKKVLKMF